MAKIRPSKLFQATLVEKDGKSAEQSKLGTLNHFRPLCGKRWKKV